LIFAVDNLRYHLDLQREKYLLLHIQWKRSLDMLPTPVGVPAWGPSEEETWQVRLERAAPRWTQAGDGDGSECSEHGESEDEAEPEDAALIAILETLDQEPEETELADDSDVFI
jgi:hypothetical protein